MTLIPDCDCNVTSQPPTFYTMMVCIPFSFVRKKIPSFLKLILVRCLATSLRKTATQKIGTKKWDRAAVNHRVRSPLGPVCVKNVAAVNHAV